MKSKIVSQKAPARVSGIKKDKDGTYRIDMVKTIAGERVHIFSTGYENKKEAMEALPSLVRYRTASLHLGTNRTTMQQFLTRFEQYRCLHVRYSTMAFGKSVVKNYLPFQEGELASEVFTYERMSEVYRLVHSKKNTPEWKNRAIGVMRTMIECAFKWRVISADAYQDCKGLLENIPENRGQKKERPIWTKAERNRFLSVIDNEADYVMFRLLISLGARISEFLGLTWDCYSYKKATIVIKQQLIYTGTGKWVLSGELKTRESYRVCSLSQEMNELLHGFQEKDKGTTFLFHDPKKPNRPISKGTFRRKLYYYIDLAKVKRITPHCIRHELATELMGVCHNMEEVKASARFLGHSATMMIDTYGHSHASATLAVLRRLEKDDASPSKNRRRSFE